MGSGASREEVLAALSTSFTKHFGLNRQQLNRDREGAAFSYTETYS
jgi:hypothetical protein